MATDFQTFIQNGGLVPLNGVPGEQCLICQAEPMENPVRVPCGHIYCRDCISGWLDGNSNRCPRRWTHENCFFWDVATNDEEQPREPTEVERILQASGLEDGTFVHFREGLITDAVLMQQAIDNAIQDWQSDVPRAPPAGNAHFAKELAYDIVAMDNLTRACAQVQDRQGDVVRFTGNELSEWDALVRALYRGIEKLTIYPYIEAYLPDWSWWAAGYALPNDLYSSRWYDALSQLVWTNLPGHQQKKYETYGRWYACYEHEGIVDPVLSNHFGCFLEYIARRALARWQAIPRGAREIVALGLTTRR